MDLKQFEFPKDQLSYDTIPFLLKEAKKRGFYNGNTKYNKLFTQLFYRGGPVHYKDGLDPVFKKAAGRYLANYMESRKPSHRDKEAISALLLSELVDIDKYNIK